MTEDGVINKIKTRGYWRINFDPLESNPFLVEDRGKCKEIVTTSAVELRGWDYPHVPTENSRKESAIYNGQNFVGSYTNWERHKEVWRLEQSGKFTHIRGFWEDWWDEDTIFVIEDRNKYPPGSILSVTSAIYTLTEIFEFLKRLAEKNVYDSGVVVSIELHNINARKLLIMEPGRFLFSEYISNVNDYVLPSQVFENGQLVLEKAHDSAIELVSDVFETFNWDKGRQPMDTFRDDQKKLLERKI